MNRFCEECGSSLKEGHVVCTNCGKRATAPAPHSRQARAMTKKLKWIFRVIALVAGIVIAFSVWATNHFSADSVNDRFIKAVNEENGEQLMKLMKHGNTTDLSQKEVEAFIALKAKRGSSDSIKDLVTVKKGGKFLGIYPTHYIEVVDQYAIYPGELDHVTFAFQGEEAKIHSKNGTESTFGPYSPGIYKGVATITSDFGDEEAAIDILLANVDSRPQVIEIRSDIGKVVFELDDSSYHELKPWIQIGEKKVDYPQNDRYLEIGPISRSGKHSAQIGVSMPWGDILSESIPIDQNYLYMQPAVVSKKELDDILLTLKDFGEEYNELLATSNREVLSTVTPVWKEDQLYREVLAYAEDGYFYAGRFDNVGIDSASIKPASNGIEIWARYDFSMDHFTADHEPNLLPVRINWIMQMSYVEETGKWVIDSTRRTDYSPNVTDEIAGIGSTHFPSADLIMVAKSKSVNSRMEEFMIMFNKKSVQAINERDFSIVADYMDEEGPAYKEARDYIDYLASKNIYETHIETELVGVEEIEPGVFKVTTVEEYDIIYTSSTARKKFDTVTIIKEIDGELYSHQLLSTKEK